MLFTLRSLFRGKLHFALMWWSRLQRLILVALSRMEALRYIRTLNLKHHQRFNGILKPTGIDV